jgi:CRISPR type I-E-associated protein CasB/Cse2
MSDPPKELVSKNPSRDEMVITQATEFINELRVIRDSDRGRMSALKRCAGEMLFGRGTSWFYSLLKTPEQRRYREIYYLIATLYDFNRVDDQKGNFGQSMLQLCVNMNRTPKEFRRFHILLDSEFEHVHDPDQPAAPWADGGGELAFRLRQTVKLMASQNIGVNWPMLIVDLCMWSHPSRRIQKKWARSFFGDVSAATNNPVDDN